MNNNNLDFKRLWASQSVVTPSIHDFKNQLTKYKNVNIRSLIILNIFLIITVSIIALIWYYANPKYLITKIGMVLSITAMLIFVLSHNTLFKSYNTIDKSLDTNEYAKRLVALKKRQNFILKTMLNLYFILLSLGIFMYMFEYVQKMNLTLAICFYSVIAVWFLYNWFYLRPKQVDKIQMKSSELIKSLNAVHKQFEKSIK